MDEKIMLNDEELNKVSGGSYEDDYSKRKAANRKEADSLIRDHKCPCCGLGIRRLGSGFACSKCRILWKI